MQKIFGLFLGVFVASFLFLGAHANVAEAAETKTFSYTVQSGDTLYSISQKFEEAVADIKDVNTSLQNTSTVYPGQVVKIPDHRYEKGLEKEVVRLTNIERTKAGLAPLTYDWELARVARIKSMDMRDNNYFSHYSPTYGDPFIMMQDFGIKFSKAGENIAARQDTPEKVVANFMSSESHRENILNPNFTKIGVGYANGGYLTHYWTQWFITP
ncbi:CAP domain-containing protein [Priestia filamentosa]|uniref:CAP domain-containing protein n=1 Tax=Priestia filamentosa TaxID=1402861 RepID=UPI00397D1ED3